MVFVPNSWAVFNFNGNVHIVTIFFRNDALNINLNKLHILKLYVIVKIITCIILGNLLGLYSFSHQSRVTGTLLLHKELYPHKSDAILFNMFFRLLRLALNKE